MLQVVLLLERAHPVRRVARRGIEALKDWGPTLLALGVVPLVAWLLLARGLRGAALALWLAVPPLSVAALVCFFGPGQVFSKAGEGPILVALSNNHAVTALDLVGVACAVVAGALAAALVLWRLRPRRPTRAAW